MNPPTVTLQQPTAQPHSAVWKRVLDSRFMPPVLITLILLAGNASFGILEGYQKTLLAIATSIVTEMVLGCIFLRKWPHPASAYITGISVGILLRSPAYWPYALCAALSISSKYVLRARGRHIWNPSNFGICALLFLASASVAGLSIQWGNNFAAVVVIWVLGSLILWRAKRFHITAVYVVSFLLLGLLRAHITGDPWQSEISPITGPMYQLFIFFMITDPKTTVRSRSGQCIVAFAIAFVEFLMRLDQSVYAPLYALFWVGPAAMLIEMWMDSRRARSFGTLSVQAARP
jgi:Na+-translocating ferredoxin:NAD+ oxidoreductase RnfD subunit